MAYRSASVAQGGQLPAPAPRAGRLSRPGRRGPGVALRHGTTLVSAVALSSVLVLASVSPAATEAKIKADWTAFFAGTTPAKNKIALFQNGSKFAAVIDAQAKSTFAESTTAKVSSVKVDSATKATVHYSIYLGGVAALKDQTGVAVLQGGTWKVGDQSFCALLAMEQTKTPACKGA